MIIYVWLLAWNVYVWTSYHVNYKLIFRFNHHYSQLSQILKRAAVFSTMLLILLLWYLVEDAHLGKTSRALDFIPKELLPGILWLGFFIYMFFPSTKIFNGPGRLYLFRVVKSIFKVPFISVIFPVNLDSQNIYLKHLIDHLGFRSAYKFCVAFKRYGIYILLLYHLLL